MKPVKFEESNTVFGKDQPEYMPLPALVKPFIIGKGDDAAVYPKGIVVSCWELSEEELAEVAKTGRIYLSVLTFGQPIQSCFITTKKEDVI